MAYRVTITTERMKVTQGYHSSWRDRMDNIMTQLIFWEQPRQRCREGSSKVGNYLARRAIHSQQDQSTIYGWPYHTKRDDILPWQVEWTTNQCDCDKAGRGASTLEWVIVWRQLIRTFTEYPLGTNLAPHVILSKWNIIGTQILQKQW